MQIEYLCICCKRRTTLKEDTLCEKCGDPDKILVYCSICNIFNPSDISALEAVEKIVKQRIKKRNGLIISLNSCHKCKNREPAKIRIILVERDEE